MYLHHQLSDCEERARGGGPGAEYWHSGPEDIEFCVSISAWWTRNELMVLTIVVIIKLSDFKANCHVLTTCTTFYLGIPDYLDVVLRLDHFLQNP